MKARLPLIIDGTEFSPMFNRYQYTVGYIPQTGENGGIMLDGSETVDVLKWKAVLTLPANDLKAEDLSRLLSACAQTYLAVTYFDTRTNQERQALFIPEIGESRFAMMTAQGVKWFSGMAVTLREK